MSSPSRLPSEHYQSAERLLAATEETPASAPLLALAHAVLATVPRKALRGRHTRQKYTPTPPMAGGGTYVDRFIRGEDEEGEA